MLIETQRLVIRDFLPDDLADLHAILGDNETMRHIEPAYPLDKTQEFLEGFCIGQRGAAAAVHRDSGQLIGYILFKEYEPEVYEIGWIFHRSFWRQGYAYEACRAIIDFAFETLGVRKVFAETTDTVKSAGLMRKLGMRLEEIQRGQSRDQEGKPCDLYLYSAEKALSVS